MVKKIFWALLLILLLLAWLWLSGHRSTAAPEERAAPATYAPLSEAATGRILVDLRDDLSKDEIARLARRHGLELRPNSRHSWARRLFRAPSSEARLSGLIQRLRADPRVEAAEPDWIYSIPPLEAEATRFGAAQQEPRPEFPNDPKYRYQWHLRQIAMPRAWARGAGDGVVVAVIDTGVAYADAEQNGRTFRRVPDLANTEIVEGYDFVNRTARALDDHGHGTHVAGTIAQSTHNGVGVAGVAYKAKIMPLKVLSARGFGSVGDIAEAVRLAANRGAKVINMSLGGSRSSKILASAVDYARKKGVVVVCAAGNEGRDRVSYPAAYPGALAVAATQYDRTTTFYSNWGDAIDLAAPGGNTRVDQNGDGVPDGVMQNTILPGHPEQDGYLLFMGTSMASPHVAGAAALLWGSGVSEADAVEKLLKTTAKHPQGKAWDPHYGAGIVDAGEALEGTKLSWGGQKLGLGLVLGLALLWPLRRPGLLALRPGFGAMLGLLIGSSGLFALSALVPEGILPAAAMGLLGSGLPAWGQALFGGSSPLGATPLFYSALIPLGLTVALWGAPRLRGLLCGLLLGVGAHLLFHVFHDSVDLAWIPNSFGLEEAWLLLNAGACLALARVVARAP